MSVFDIHAHIIPLLDDGSKSTGDSVAVLRDAIKHGVTDIIATPHYCPNRGYNNPVGTVIEKFNEFVAQVKNDNLPINIYPGEEIYCSEYDKVIEKLDAGELLTLNKTEYVLLEYSVSSMPKNLLDNLYNMSIHGYRPIIAHVERYRWMTARIAQELRDEGCLLQVNASSFKDLKHIMFCKKLKAENLIDLVASDAHCGRKNCYDNFEKVYISDKANDALSKIFRSDS